MNYIIIAACWNFCQTDTCNTVEYQITKGTLL